jgi:hypothetical protein
MAREVSLKEIVAAIDKALAELEPGYEKATLTKDNERVLRTIRVLKGLRESTEGMCLPNFDIPVP